MAADLTNAQWRKSSRSNGNGGACVEIAHLATTMAVRDSKNPNGPALVFVPAAFGAFLSTVKAGALDI